MKWLVIVAGVVVFALPVWANDPPVASRYDLSFKCVSDEKGGYHASASGLSFTQFYGQEEFFVTHYSDLPIEAIVFEDQLEPEKGLTESFWRDAMADFEQSDYHEGGSYFMRESSTDPKIHRLLWMQCETYGTHNSETNKWDANPAKIKCQDSNKMFQMNTKTGRFAYSYLGSWIDGKTEFDGEPYYGDSALFAMGQCKVYYP